MVEVDGPIHLSQTESDQQRMQMLEGQGYRVLRLPNDQVESDLDSALQTILAACSED